MVRRYRKFVPIETKIAEVLELTRAGKTSAQIVGELGVGQAAIERAWSAAGGKDAFIKYGPASPKASPKPAAFEMSTEHLRRLARLGKELAADPALTQFCLQTKLKRCDVVRWLQNRYGITEKAPRILLARLVEDRSI